VTGRTDGKDIEPTNRLNGFPATGEGQPSSTPGGLVSLLVVRTAQSGPDTDEPDELIAHVRVCGEDGWVTAVLTRHPDRGPIAVWSEYAKFRLGRGG
jgi:hypothetical protein